MLKYKETTSKIIEVFYDIYNELGYGFLERVYQNAMFYALKDAGLKVEGQKAINVYSRGRLVGAYFADILVNGVVIVELKAVEEINTAHQAQLLNYLKASHIEVGILLNFGKKPEMKRLYFSSTDDE